MNGNNIIIKMGGTQIAATRSQEIQTSVGTIEIASPTQNGWREFIADRKEWSVTVNFLVTAAAGLEKMLQVGNTYTLVVVDRANTHDLQGSAILTTARQTYTRGNLVQGSFQFQGISSLV